MSASDNPVSLATEIVIAAISPFNRDRIGPINIAALILARAARRLGILPDLELAIAELARAPGGRS